MKRRWHIALVAIFALAIHSFGFCTAAATGCVASVCGAHQQNGSCHRHSRHSGGESNHDCCASPICLSGAELTADKDASASHVPMLLPVVFTLPSIVLTESSIRLAALTRVHAPPPHVPIFLSIRTLLI